MKKLLLAALMMTLALGGWAQVRTGAWVDEVVFVEEPSAAKGVEMVQRGTADVYACGVSTPHVVKTITETVGYEVSYGLYNEITFNPYGPEFKDGRLNPFSVPAIRAAMNMLVDRNHIVRGFYAGVAGFAQYFPMPPCSLDYAKLTGDTRELEILYAYDFARGKALITAEMEKLGATLVGGKWTYKGRPVVLKILIQTEDWGKQTGDYVAGNLDEIGFTTDRMYMTSAEVAGIGISGDPADGLFHIFTGDWQATAVPRNQAGNWSYFYTADYLASPLNLAFKPAPEAYALWERLSRNDFATAGERLAMMAQAAEYGMKDSQRIWITNHAGYFARNKEISVASDLAGGVYGAALWAHTLRFVDRVGGMVLIAQASMLT